MHPTSCAVAGNTADEKGTPSPLPAPAAVTVRPRPPARPCSPPRSPANLLPQPGCFRHHRHELTTGRHTPSAAVVSLARGGHACALSTSLIHCPRTASTRVPPYLQILTPHLDPPLDEEEMEYTAPRAGAVHIAITVASLATCTSADCLRHALEVGRPVPYLGTPF